jgi:hypothetical protein
MQCDGFPGLEVGPGQTLDGVALGLKSLKAHAGKVEGVSICHGHKGVFRLGETRQI